MKKLLPIIIIVVVLVGGWIYLVRGSSETAVTFDNGTTSESKTFIGGGAQDNGSADFSGSESLNFDDEEDDYFDETIKPAAQVYDSAQAAIDAVRKGAEAYDDIVLEQFVQPGGDCDWCPDFYAELNELMLSPNASEYEKSYFGEILAISGRVDNIATLIEALKNAPSEDDSDIFAESLEVAIGDNSVVKYLSEQMNSGNALLDESLVAAVTNHGSNLAVETLYEQTVKNGDPDGYYSVGIGLGEVIPDEEAVPFLIEALSKRDSYSHLAVKSLLNMGDAGLETVLSQLEGFGDDVNMANLIEDAVDHVALEDRTEEIIASRRDSENPVIKEFIRQIKEDLDLDDDEEE